VSRIARVGSRVEVSVDYVAGVGVEYVVGDGVDHVADDEG
jgi:hypothetical protein